MSGEQAIACPCGRGSVTSDSAEIVEQLLGSSCLGCGRVLGRAAGGFAFVGVALREATRLVRVRCPVCGLPDASMPPENARVVRELHAEICGARWDGAP